MSKRQYVEASKLTAEELRSLPVGTVVQVSLGLGQRLLMRHTADGRYCPVRGSGLSVGALVEVAELLAPRSLSAQPAVDSE
ncbi:hypothetical protein [Streptomyces coerulescens]|uniref:Ferrous iron transport protein A n=1 Tax=Streptomyces coerulescens TaxID=29304 RepID=A0ABW0CLQ3_STRCD